MDLETLARNIVGKKLLNLIENNPDKKWDWRKLSGNPNITMDIIRENPDKPWDWVEISCCNQNITWDIIEENPYKPWDFYNISENPNITINDIQNYPNKSWKWYAISRNSFEKDYKENLRRLQNRFGLINYRKDFRWKYLGFK